MENTVFLGRRYTDATGMWKGVPVPALELSFTAVGGKSLALIRAFVIPMKPFISTLASVLHI